MDMNRQQFITAREYAAKHGVSKPWVIKLAVQGRIGGAHKAGAVWLMPADAPFPDTGGRGPKAVFDADVALVAVERGVRLVRDVPEALRAKIDWHLDRGWRMRGGSWQSPTEPGRWLMPFEGWGDRAEAYCLRRMRELGIG